MTDDRVREQVGGLHLVAAGDRLTGPGAGFIMGAFTHLSTGSRFTDGTFGAYYTAREHETAVRETAHHRARFLAATREPPMEIAMQMLAATLEAKLHDLRGRAKEWPELYHPTDYTASARLARQVREHLSWGIAYDSVRHPGSECAAVFRPPALSDCKVVGHLVYLWDGKRIAGIREIAVR